MPEMGHPRTECVQVTLTPMRSDSCLVQGVPEQLCSLSQSDAYLYEVANNFQMGTGPVCKGLCVFVDGPCTSPVGLIMFIYVYSEH